MIITSVRELKISRKKIRVGKYSYNLDHKDPTVAMQLRIYRKMGFIHFGEILEGDVVEAPNVPAIDKPVEPVGEVGSADSSGGDVPEQETDKSAGRSKVSKRRDRKDKAE